MKKYIEIEWPGIQAFMDNPKWDEDVGFDPIKNVWYVPEDIINSK